MEWESVGAVIAVVVGGFTLLDRVWGPQALRLKALEDRMHAQDLVSQKLGLQYESLEKVLSRLADSIDRLELRVDGSHR